VINDNIMMPHPMKLTYEKIFKRICFFIRKIYYGFKVDEDSLDKIALLRKELKEPVVVPKYGDHQKVPYTELPKIHEALDKIKVKEPNSCQSLTQEEIALLLSMTGETHDKVVVKNYNKGTRLGRRDVTPLGRKYTSKILETICMTEFNSLTKTQINALFLKHMQDALDQITNTENPPYDDLTRSITRKRTQDYKNLKIAQMYLINRIEERSGQILAGTRIAYVNLCPTEKNKPHKPKLRDETSEDDKKRYLWEDADYAKENKLTLDIPTYITTQIWAPTKTYLIDTEIIDSKLALQLTTQYQHRWQQHICQSQNIADAFKKVSANSRLVSAPQTPAPPPPPSLPSSFETEVDIEIDRDISYF